MADSNEYLYTFRLSRLAPQYCNTCVGAMYTFSAQWLTPITSSSWVRSVDIVTTDTSISQRLGFASVYDSSFTDGNHIQGHLRLSLHIYPASPAIYDSILSVSVLRVQLLRPQALLKGEQP
jgi:hypothetical protein